MNDQIIVERHGRLCQIVEMLLNGTIGVDIARQEWDKMNIDLPVPGPSAERLKTIVESAEADD